MKLFDTNLTALEANMNMRLKRQNIISSNIANVNTPGFQAKDIKFTEALKDVYENGGLESSPSISMINTDDMHLEGESASPGINPELEQYVVQAPGIDENSVDLDREMARMAENSIMYSAASIIIKKKFGMLKYAAQEASK